MAQLDFIYFDSVITDGSNESAEFNLKGNTLMGFIFPIGFEGTTITIKARRKHDFSTGGYNGPFKVTDPTTGAAITIYAGDGTGCFVPITPSDLAALQHFTIVSSSAATEDRTVTAVARPAV